MTLSWTEILFHLQVWGSLLPTIWDQFGLTSTVAILVLHQVLYLSLMFWAGLIIVLPPLILFGYQVDKISEYLRFSQLLLVFHLIGNVSTSNPNSEQIFLHTVPTTWFCLSVYVVPVPRRGWVELSNWGKGWNLIEPNGEFQLWAVAACGRNRFGGRGGNLIAKENLRVPFISTQSQSY